MPSHKSFRTKVKLAKAQKQNRPIPQWIRLRTGNTIRWRSEQGLTGCKQIQRQEKALAQDSSRYLDAERDFPLPRPAFTLTTRHLVCPHDTPPILGLSLWR
ncbi:putative Large ribosomal subunit protein eL39 [Seiridium cardinale]|uniref:Large ribosomal subunit protein eL39 n=1 Tax=Seiridium cardinale TaxID=138064 RepID=A0ABR2Y014_9PEZI